MPQVFNSTPIQGDVWDMQGALIYFGSSGAPTANAVPTQYNAQGSAPIVALGVQLSYGRALSKRYPINVRRVIYMLGNPEGSLTLSVLFGPNQSMTTFINQFSSVGNNPDTVGVGNGSKAIYIKPFGTISAGGTNNTSNLGLGTWKITDPVINQIGLTISESGSAVPAVSQVTMQFTNLSID